MTGGSLLQVDKLQGASKPKLQEMFKKYNGA